MTALSVDAITITRGGRNIANQVGFTVERGSRVALMGPSGSGKTTVLRAIAGLEPFDAGRIAIGDATLDHGRHPARALRAWHRRVGLVFQFHHLFAHLTAIDNVTLAPVHAYGRAHEEATERARELLRALGVGHCERAFPHQVSGGEAQRIAIARALAVDPPLLLMDEPTASLDATRRSELAGVLAGLADTGTTILVTTHDHDFAHAFAQRVIRMTHGVLTTDPVA